MKKLLIAISLIVVTADIVPIDWRYKFTWEDPNPAGLIVGWTVYASNSAAVRMTSGRMPPVDLQPLLNGAPAGNYALFTIGTTALGDTTDASTNSYVAWPGGNGKAKPGKNNQIAR